MRLAIANSDDDILFRSCINGYLALARSVTMVMERESGGGELRYWYKQKAAELGASPLFRFFNSQRVYSIHKGVVNPQSRAIETEEATFWYEQTDAGRKLAGTMTLLSENPPVHLDDIFHVDGANQRVTVWLFDDVGEFIPSDTGNVLRLCESYFVALKSFVQEWIRERHRLDVSG